MSAKPKKDPKATPSETSGDNGKGDKGGDKAKERLPFEPAQTRKKTPKKQPAPAIAKPQDSAASKTGSTSSPSKQATAIPEVVSKRMARRMAFFCGIPTALGMLTLVISYIIVSNHWYKLPNVAVLLVNLGFFGLGVLGLSYGALSASWDEERLGGWFGWSEFRNNVPRLTESWRSVRQKSDS